MDWLEMLDCFELNDQLAIHDQIEPIATVQMHALVTDRQGNLPLEGDLAKGQFMAKAGFVSRLKQARPKLPMNLDGCADDR